MKRYRFYIDRISALKWFLMLLFLIVSVGLFKLQVMDYEKYSTYAKLRMEDKIIRARRGRILLRDGHQGFFELGNNVSLELFSADPYLISKIIQGKELLKVKNPERAEKISTHTASEIAKLIGPILFEMIKEQSSYCDEQTDCLAQNLEDAFFAEKRFYEQEKIKEQLLLNPSLKIPALPKRTESELLTEYIDDLTSLLSKTERESAILKMGLGVETIKKIQELAFSGIKTTQNSVIAFPQQIQDQKSVAASLSSILEIPEKDLEFLLTSRPNRYIKIKNRIDFETAEKIRALRITGLRFEKEFFRNYAEQEGSPFAPQILGFLDHEFQPIYGVEKSMNPLLAGKTGHIRGEVDLEGRPLTARSNVVKDIEQAINGTDIVLTLDQVIQNKAEELLQAQVKESQAKSGQVIVQDPFTGRILAMASYPGFNPNRPGEVYEKQTIELTLDQIRNLEVVSSGNEKRYFLAKNPGYKIEVFHPTETQYQIYKNKEGIGVYRNPVVSDIYEPGSVLKAIVMGAAIDSKEVRPSDIFVDRGPLEVDCHSVWSGGNRQEVCDYTIKNSTGQYFGSVTMTQILEKSLNTGMTYIAKKLGPSLMYDYLKNFGFGEKTFIELPEENSGKLPHYRNWISESDLITKAFGQGIAVTPLQLINAFSAVINGGLLYQPTLVAGVLDENGMLHEEEPKIIRRVISESSSIIMKSMLVSSVERGYAQKGSIPGYKVGGKTGTSQIATAGMYEQGEGSTIASFAGFAPYEKPRFSILVKIDRPRTSIWGESNAAPLFQKLATFLLDYEQIPPEKNE